MAHALTIVRKYFPHVKVIENATKPINIEVTARDEANSKKKHHTVCAMATACKRAMKLDGVVMSITTVFLIKDNVATRYAVPERVSREVISYDRGGGFAPGEYTLKKPDARHRPSRSGSRGKSKSRMVRHHFTTGIRTILGAAEVSA